MRFHVAQDEIQRLRAQLNEAAAFLDRMANRLEWPDMRPRLAAADCRAWAKKLRGET